MRPSAGLGTILKSTALAVALLCLISAAPAQVPVSVLLDNIKEPANYVGHYLFREKPAENQETGPEKMNAQEAGAIYERATQCTAAVDKALAAGVPVTRTITVRVVETTEGAMEGEDRAMSLADVKDMCQRMGALSGRAHFLADAAQMAVNASGWPKMFANGEVNGWQARGALMAGKDCVVAIDKAYANGVPDSTVIEMLGSDTKPLNEAHEMCVYVRDEAQKIVDKETAAQEAEYKPYRDVLSGDKLALYNSRMKMMKVYGHGGRVLRTPADYKLSNVWCEAGVNREGAMPMWELACWRFVGMKKVSGPTTKQGVGDQPPSSAFP